MSTTLSAIIDRRPAQEGKPGIVYRYAGDRAVLVEYGDMDFDLTLNFFVLAVDDALRAHGLPGVIETAPGFRSILISYDPSELPVGELVDRLHAIHDELQVERGMEIPQVASPIRLSETPASYRTPPPRLAGRQGSVKDHSQSEQRH